MASTCNGEQMLSVRLSNLSSANVSSNQRYVHDIGPWLFTKLLMPTLLEGAKNSPDGKARIVATSSSAMYIISKLKYDTFKDGPARRKLSRQTLYGQSKFVCYLRQREHFVN